MKKFFLFLLVQSCAFSILAQTPPIKNSIRVGVDFMTLDAPDAMGLRYQIRYTRHLLNNRLLLGASIGYFGKNTQQNLLGDVYVNGHTRQRLMTDISVLADLLPSPKQALRLGGGLSLWYRKDNIWTGIDYKVGEDGKIYDLQIDRYRLEELNIGYHFALEYERSIANRFAVNSRVGWADLQKASSSIQAGVGISYLLR